MPVSKEEVINIANLAKLQITEEEVEKYTQDLNNILEYMQKLNEIDTSNVEPLSHPVENKNVFREDILRPSVTTEDALKNAPDRTDKFFRVPKVINVEK